MKVSEEMLKFLMVVSSDTPRSQIKSYLIDDPFYRDNIKPLADEGCITIYEYKKGNVRVGEVTKKGKDLVATMTSYFAIQLTNPTETKEVSSLDEPYHE